MTDRWAAGGHRRGCAVRIEQRNNINPERFSAWSRCLRLSAFRRVRAWDRLSRGDRVLGEGEQDLSGASWCHRTFECLAVVVQPVGGVDRDGDHAGGDEVAERAVGLLDLGARRVAQPVEQPEAGERYLVEDE